MEELSFSPEHVLSSKTVENQGPHQLPRFIVSTMGHRSMKEKKRATNMFEENNSKEDRHLKELLHETTSLYVSLLSAFERLDASLVQESRIAVSAYKFLEMIEKVVNHSTMKRDIGIFLTTMSITHDEARISRKEAHTELEDYEFESRLVFDHQTEGSSDTNPTLTPSKALHTLRATYVSSNDLVQWLQNRRNSNDQASEDFTWSPRYSKIGDDVYGIMGLRET